MNRVTSLAARGLAAVAVVVAVLVGLASPLSATWSIVAIDPETGLVGGAMASCVQGDVLGNPDEAFAPLILIPGAAVGVVQGDIEFATPGAMRTQLERGSTPEQAIDALLTDDPQALSRQFSAVTGGPGPTGAGGAESGPLAGPRPVDALGYVGDDAAPESGAAWSTAPDAYSVQGVSLADSEVIEATAAAFESSRKQGRSLDRALVDALLAGSASGGDVRCTDQTALFAHVAVAEPDDDAVAPSLVLTVLVDRDDGQNPVMLLDRFLDEGRTGWVDVGLNEPSGLPRLIVLVVGALLGLGALVVLRSGLGNRTARR